MSEQIAMPHEEFDSTNNRLDSILDRLNALGASADDLKTAPLQPLQPQTLEPLQPMPEMIAPPTAEFLEPIEPIEAPVPPTLGLVAPLSAVAPAPTLDPHVTTADQPVMPAPVQIEPLAPVELAPEPQFAAEPEATFVEPAQIAPEPEATFVEPVQIAPEPEATFVEAPQAVAEISEVADFSQIPEGAHFPDLEPLPEPQSPEPPTLDVAVDGLQGEAELSQSEISPDLQDPGPVALEYHDLDLETAPDDPRDLVFELGEPLDGPSVSAASIFGTTSTPPLTDETIDIDDGEGGWVSHEKSIPISQPASEPEPVFEAPEFARDELSAPEETAEVESFGEPDWDAAAPIESAIDTTSDMTFEDTVFEELVIDEFEIDGLPDVVEDEPHPMLADDAGLDDAQAYLTDPGTTPPDYVSVHPDAVPEDLINTPDAGLSSNETSAMTQDDLDLLRPDEEAIAKEAPAPNSSRKLQLVMVVLFGLIALAVIYLDDPAAVDSIRESIDSLRN